MEKFSNFRDRGSGISPFLPISTPSGSYFWLATHVFLFVVKLIFFVPYMVLFFLFLQWLSFSLWLRKLLLWTTLALPGIWWVDLQLDGVKRGGVSRQPDRLPKGPCVLAANFTSPVDALYLAAVFDPVFAISFPDTRLVRPASLLRMFLHALSRAQLREGPRTPEEKSSLVDMASLMKKYPDRIIVVFPECATTNGRGVMPLSPSLADVPADTGIYPLSIRYTAPDITTPVPGARAWARFLWKLLSRPTHTLRVRIAEVHHNTKKPGNSSSGSTSGSSSSNASASSSRPNGNGNHGGNGEAKGASGRGGDAELTIAEQWSLDRVAEALARLGRVKRVGLTVRDKAAFVKLWNKSR